MSSGNSIRDMFFEECDELLEAISDGLAAMEADEAEEDTIHSVFRGVHSVKGGAGAFALEEVVNFAHKFETVLDRVRSDEIEADQALMAVLQRAGDQLSSLIELARDGRDERTAETETILEALAEYLPEEAAGGGGDASFDAVSLAFEPPPMLDLSLDLPGDEPDAASEEPVGEGFATVSYTHLTLPTKA